MTRFGMGYDVHRLVEGRKLIIGGVEIPHALGLLGHSDADVLLHAISDALLGAAALGDIGRHFPDTDPRYEGADSMKLLGSPPPAGGEGLPHRQCRCDDRRPEAEDEGLHPADEREHRAGARRLA